MKQYWSIPGWKNAAIGLPCIAFDKLDGSNLRFEWSRKSGWYKAGSRTVLLDESHPDLGCGIPLFENTLSEPVGKVLFDMRVERAVVYCEFFGPNSFAGQHVQSDPKSLVILDVNIHKRGIVLPRDFIKTFGHLPIPKVIYEGNFNHSFVEAVRNGEYPVSGEGIVAKGVNPKAKKEQHGLWMAKIKTKAWLEKLKAFCAANPGFEQVLRENMQEQEVA